MAVKTHFSNDNFAHILSQYSLGAFTQAIPISQGTIQTNYILHTTQGKFVLRYYECRTIESVLFESDLLTYLEKHGFPSPAPLQNEHGDCVGLYNEKPYIILEHIRGEHIENPGDHHRKQVIETVAWLQSLTEGFQPCFVEHRWNYTPDLCRKLARTEAQNIDTEDAYLKYAWLERQLGALDLPPSLPKGICHCDFHYANMLFRDDCLVGLLDFDDANYTYLQFDLACLIDTWAWPRRSHGLDLAGAREIAQAYSQSRPLSALEQRHTFDVHKLSILFDCIWFFDRGPASDFRERKKIESLDQLGREGYVNALFLARESA